MKMKTRVNSIPFFLWATHSRELEIDFEKNIAKSDLAESKIEKANPIVIIILKYLPIVLILLAGGRIPLLDELGSIAISITVVSFLFFTGYLAMAQKSIFLFYFVLISICLLVLYLMFYTHVDVYAIESSAIFAVQFIFVAILSIDIWKKNYEKYYWLTDLEKNINLKIARKNMSFNIGGIFVKVEKD